MRRAIRGFLPLLFALALAGCGDDDVRAVPPGLVVIDDQPEVVVTAPLLRITWRDPPAFPDPVVSDILSDYFVDGDIKFDPVTGSYFITQGTANEVVFGVDALDPHWPEYRAFLDFPLGGETGGDPIPVTAEVLEAWLTVSVVAVHDAPVIPALLDLVRYVDPGLILRPEDFSSPSLLTRSPFEFFVEDTGNDVRINVTPLMQEVQRRGLPDFQARFRIDFSRVPLAPGAVPKPPSGIR